MSEIKALEGYDIQIKGANGIAFEGTLIDKKEVDKIVQETQKNIKTLEEELQKSNKELEETKTSLKTQKDNYEEYQKTAEDEKKFKVAA